MPACTSSTLRCRLRGIMSQPKHSPDLLPVERNAKRGWRAPPPPLALWALAVRRVRRCKGRRIAEGAEVVGGGDRDARQRVRDGDALVGVVEEGAVGDRRRSVP